MMPIKAAVVMLALAGSFLCAIEPLAASADEPLEWLYQGQTLEQWREQLGAEERIAADAATIR